MSKNLSVQPLPAHGAELDARRSRVPRRSRRGVVLAIVLATMVLLLLMLGGLARRVMIEQRAIDSRATSLQADWLLWSAKHRAEFQLQGKTDPTTWDLTPSDPNLGKQISARVLDLVPDLAADEGVKQGSLKNARQIELHWTTPSGLVMERTCILKPPANQPKDTP